MPAIYLPHRTCSLDMPTPTQMDIRSDGFDVANPFAEFPVTLGVASNTYMQIITIDHRQRIALWAGTGTAVRMRGCRSGIWSARPRARPSAFLGGFLRPLFRVWGLPQLIFERN